MYRKEVNQRSPLRVFERSIHGGLGKGNVGVVLSRAGVGKTAFLVGVALDDLMRQRKVLHINIDDPVEKVREFYDEVFQDLADKTNLEERARVHVGVERHRMIQTYRHGSFHMSKLHSSLEMMREHMLFEPEVILIDGYPPFSECTEDEVKQIKSLAVELGAEVWLTALTHRDDKFDERGVADFVARFEEYISVIVKLESANDHVKLNLIKDHENEDVANLQIELDPRTLLLRWV